MLRPEIEYANNPNTFKINWYDKNNELTTTYNFLINNEVEENTFEVESAIRKFKGEKIIPEIVKSLDSLLTEVATNKGKNLKHVECTQANTNLADYLKENYVKEGYKYKGIEDGFILLEKTYTSIN